MRLHLRFISLFTSILFAIGMAKATTHEVILENGSISPFYLHVDIGDTVRWLNQSGQNRYITTYQGEFYSGIIQPGASWSRRMTVRGSHNYTDLYNSNMRATLDVATSTDPVWNELTSPEFNFGLQDVVFTDSLHGYCATGLGVYYTTNGGDSWTLSRFTEGARSLQFLTPTLGWACGDDGYIHRTTDAGVTWENMYIAGELTRDIHFTDSLYGWACGWHGLRPRTTNGGASWTPAAHGHLFYFTSLDFLDRSNGWMCGNRGRIYMTTDGGANWAEQNSFSDYDSTFHSIDMWNAQLGVVVGTDGMIFRTTNGGEDWTQVASGTNRELFKVQMVTESLVWVCGDSGYIARSVDGGVTWTQLETPCVSRISSLCFTSPGNGYFSTYAGRVFHYRNDEELPPPPIVPAEVARPADGNWFPIQNPQSYPNPFNPVANIEFTLTAASDVKLEVFDMLGRSVAVLANGALPEGRHVAAFNAANLASGMYFYQLTAGVQTETRKMLLQK